VLFYNSIVSPFYCQFLLESGDTAVWGTCYFINMFFLQSDHVLKKLKQKKNCNNAAWFCSFRKGFGQL